MAVPLARGNEPMRTYCAIVNNQTHWNGWFSCIHWAQDRINIDSALVVKIHVARPDEKLMRVVAEITSQGIRHIQNGRYVRVRKATLRHG